MYLYDINKDKIDVYEMSPWSDKIAEFKKNEMEKVPFEQRVLRASTNYEHELEKNDRPISYDKLQYKTYGVWGGTFYHNVVSYQMSDYEKERQAQLLNEYYTGHIDSSKIALIEKHNKEEDRDEIVKYLLLTDTYHYDHGEYVMNDIISIPKSLYLLNLLEQGKFYNYDIEHEDISRQLETFDISKNPVWSLSLKELSDIYQFELLPGQYYNVVEKAEKTQKILQKIKR